MLRPGADVRANGGRRAGPATLHRSLLRVGHRARPEHLHIIN